MKKIFVALSFVIASGSHAGIIDFQDVTSGSCASKGNSVSSRGFDFTGNPSDPNLYVCNAGVIQNNTSASLIDANSTSIITMTASDSSLFSLQLITLKAKNTKNSKLKKACHLYSIEYLGL